MPGHSGVRKPGRPEVIPSYFRPVPHHELWHAHCRSRWDQCRSSRNWAAKVCERIHANFREGEPLKIDKNQPIHAIEATKWAKEDSIEPDAPVKKLSAMDLYHPKDNLTGAEIQEFG